MDHQKTKVLIGCPVLQKPEILEAYLKSLDRLEKEDLRVEYMFVDDNTDPRSKELLRSFAAKNETVHIAEAVEEEKISKYRCDGNTHYWNSELMNKVGEFKNKIIEYALDHHFDHLFLVDSDLILHKRLLKHLLSHRLHIVSEIFWTKWTPQSMEEPNVWLYDQYSLAQKTASESLDPLEAFTRKMEFLTKLRIPGLYKVGGLGACTLISRHAMQKGVSFRPIENLKMLRGEDRFFCIRAVVLGLELFVDTHYPAYHIYRESDLPGVASYVSKNKD